MATQVLIIDDLDGVSEATTCSFALDGTEYEIDLSERNREVLTQKLERYLTVARPARWDAPKTRKAHKAHKAKKGAEAPAQARTQALAAANELRRGPGGAIVGLEVKALRAWAQQQGYAVADKGRIPAPVFAAYQAAHA